jgi:hypothetical protein
MKVHGLVAPYDGDGGELFHLKTGKNYTNRRGLKRICGMESSSFSSSSSKFSGRIEDEDEKEDEEDSIGVS